MSKKIKYCFLPGSSWVYFKIYCENESSNRLLINNIGPISRLLEKQKVIDKWFYVRYSDPHYHIRIRIHLINRGDLSSVLEMFRSNMSNCFKNRQIYKLQLDTYKRELLRYGRNSMKLAETYFYHDSYTIIHYLSRFSDESLFVQACKLIEYRLRLFIRDERELISFLDRMQSSFKVEFEPNKMVVKQLSLAYRKFEIEFDKTKRGNLNNTKLEKAISKILFYESKKILQVPIFDLINSFMHMTINRFFKHNQREYEMVVYDFLFRKLKSNSLRNV